METSKDIHARLAKLGLTVPEILFPKKEIDLEKWAVIACDQFTQDEKYWETVESLAGNDPSTFNLIFPEIYLKKTSKISEQDRKNAIHQNMRICLEQEVFAPGRRCGVYLERDTPYHSGRRGLVLAIDLDKYNWVPGERPLIRATEATVPSRLPPRMEIRRGAPLETTHVLLLLDDEEDTLIPSLGEEAKKTPLLYNSPLMMNSGKIRGWPLDTEKVWEILALGLEKLAQKAGQRYGTKDKEPFLYAVGDGNHSLAAAKAIWEEYKTLHPETIHPCRYALVELENLYDPGISFEPIHRVILGAEPKEVLQELEKLPDFTVKKMEHAGKPVNVFSVHSDSVDIAAVSIEPLLNNFVTRKGPGVSMDYIHGKEELFRLALDPARRATGVLLPSIRKNGFFKTIAQNGALPCKSFSMGEGCEKRFYLECKKLFYPDF